MTRIKNDDAGAVAEADTQVLCWRKRAPVDVELCFACGTGCTAAQHLTGRVPDPDLHWLPMITEAGLIR